MARHTVLAAIVVLSLFNSTWAGPCKPSSSTTTTDVETITSTFVSETTVSTASTTETSVEVVSTSSVETTSTTTTEETTSAAESTTTTTSAAESTTTTTSTAETTTTTTSTTPTSQALAESTYHLQVTGGTYNGKYAYVRGLPVGSLYLQDSVIGAGVVTIESGTSRLMVDGYYPQVSKTSAIGRITIYDPPRDNLSYLICSKVNSIFQCSAETPGGAGNAIAANVPMQLVWISSSNPGTGNVVISLTCSAA
ncbi:hypothetical protein AK830_g942 [Neonectria ditissima]|uniref:Ig-like domain-containing protein n=1 Tax=Neonectria ditissima TaxID=78410 RepID=A0A0P7BVP9_9HYPO|nr:hypothetical protein AK830_g942 [Neonectria ditissima]